MQGVRIETRMAFMAGLDLANAVGLMADMAKAAKRLLEAREEVKVNDVAIHFQGIALDLQTELMMIQSNYQNTLQTWKT